MILNILILERGGGGEPEYPKKKLRSTGEIKYEEFNLHELLTRDDAHTTLVLA